MGWFDWMSKDPGPQAAQDQKKLLAENNEALAGMELLVAKINASQKGDQGMESNGEMEAYLNRLRREGRGF